MQKQVKITNIQFVCQGRFFVLCTNEGFRVHETASCGLRLDTKIPGGTSLVKPYGQSNIFFMVGTGEDHRFPRTQLNLWNDEEKRVEGKVTF